jgi:5-methylcytosine-specific restriction enzyme subunit McrC
MLTYAWGGLLVGQQLKHLDVDESPSLDALLATILGFLIRQRLRIGLGRSYISEEHRLRGIRGRVDFAESVKKLAFENGQACCRFQIFTSNAPKNQIIRSTVMRLVQAGDFGPVKEKAEELRQELRRLVRTLDGVDVIPVSRALIARQHLGRNDAEYQLMLTICDLLLERQMPTEHHGPKRLVGLHRDALTLYRIFERFVANFYRFRLRGWFVRAQHPLQWQTTINSQFLPGMVTDLLLQRRDDGRSILLDTKFTPHSLLYARSDKLIFDPSHLYQMYAYLRSQEHLSEALRTASGILLYPTVEWHLSEEIQLQGHLIRFETVDLAKPWKEIEERLLKLIDSAPTRASTAREETQMASKDPA